MCEPATAAAMLSVGSSVLEYNENRQAYNDTVAANQRTRMSAVQSRDLQISQTQLRNQQEQERIAEQKFDNLLASIEQTESFKTAAGEDNIVGRSIQMALSDRVADGLRNRSRLSGQSKMVDQQMILDSQGIQAQLEGRLAQIQDPRPPSLIGAVVKGGANAMAASSGFTNTSWADLGFA
jgi:hypothetical protein